jgi:hypothetical protein
MRLTDELAARRCIYPRSLPTAPAVMLIDIPPRWAGDDLLSSRFYPIVVESDAELAELEAWLSAPRPALVAPELLAARPSNLTATAITFFEYAPPANGWPWVLLCHWPADLAALGAISPKILARGAYTIEAFDRREDLLAAARMFAGILGGNAQVHSFAEFSGSTGNA